MNNLGDKVLLAYHASAMSATIYFLYLGMFAPFEVDFLFHLTYITEEILIGYFAWCLMQDIRNVFSNSSQKQRYEDATYTMLQMLCSVTSLVTVGYWSVRLRDVNLMLSPENQGDPIIIPLYHHGINAVMCLSELILFQQKSVKDFKWKLRAIAIGTVIYVSIQTLFHAKTGRHVYPFLRAFSLKQICGFYASLAVFVVVVDRIVALIVHLKNKKAHQALIEETEKPAHKIKAM